MPFHARIKPNSQNTWKHQLGSLKLLNTRKKVLLYISNQQLCSRPVILSGITSYVLHVLYITGVEVDPIAILRTCPCHTGSGSPLEKSIVCSLAVSDPRNSVCFCLCECSSFNL